VDKEGVKCVAVVTAGVIWVLVVVVTAGAICVLVVVVTAGAICVLVLTCRVNGDVVDAAASVGDVTVTVVGTRIVGVDVIVVAGQVVVDSIAFESSSAIVHVSGMHDSVLLKIWVEIQSDVIDVDGIRVPEDVPVGMLSSQSFDGTHSLHSHTLSLSVHGKVSGLVVDVSGVHRAHQRPLFATPPSVAVPAVELASPGPAMMQLGSTWHHRPRLA